MSDQTKELFQSNLEYVLDSWSKYRLIPELDSAELEEVHNYLYLQPKVEPELIQTIRGMCT